MGKLFVDIHPRNTLFDVMYDDYEGWAPNEVRAMCVGQYVW